MTIVRIGKTHRLCDAAIYNGIAYLSGAVGRTGSDVATQTKAALDEIDEVLKAAGTDKTRLLSATIWLADIADIGAMNEVWDAWVDKDNPPARATGQVPLAREKYRVEITVTAAVVQPCTDPRKLDRS